MSVKRYSVWEDEMFEEKHAINSTNGMVHLMVKHEDYAALEQKLAESQREFRAADATIENLQMQVEKLAAENTGLKATAILLADEANQVYRRWNLIQQPDGDIVDMQTIHELLCACHETPATDAFLAEVRASAIPEGYVLVPQQIFLEPSDIESICSQCGDGHESGYGDFTDGLLWVGNIQRDDGSIVHGLHISSADYSEEGGVTVCEFAAQLRKGGSHE